MESENLRAKTLQLWSILPAPSEKILHFGGGIYGTESETYSKTGQHQGSDTFAPVAKGRPRDER